MQWKAENQTFDRERQRRQVNVKATYPQMPQYITSADWFSFIHLPKEYLQNKMKKKQK